MPLLLVLLLGEETGPFPAAAAVFGAAALTDAADGHIARSRDMVTTFGRIADPLADKLLVGTALASLVMIDRLALWIALVIGLREASVALLRWHAGRQGIVLHVSPLGKAKTGFQMTAIVALMLVPDPEAAWVPRAAGRGGPHGGVRAAVPARVRAQPCAPVVAADELEVGRVQPPDQLEVLAHVARPVGDDPAAVVAVPGVAARPGRAGEARLHLAVGGGLDLGALDRAAPRSRWSSIAWRM